jgi:hypothetical protein
MRPSLDIEVTAVGAVRRPDKPQAKASGERAARRAMRDGAVGAKRWNQGAGGGGGHEAGTSPRASCLAFTGDARACVPGRGCRAARAASAQAILGVPCRR